MFGSRTSGSRRGTSERISIRLVTGMITGWAIDGTVFRGGDGGLHRVPDLVAALEFGVEGVLAIELQQGADGIEHDARLLGHLLTRRTVAGRRVRGRRVRCGGAPVS